MRNFYRALLCVSSTLILACGAHNTVGQKPRATRGVLDLHDWDFDKNGPVDLSGEWQFYWQQFMPPEQLRANSASDLYKTNSTDQTTVPLYVPVPGGWNDYSLPGSNQTIGADGFATYHLRIILPPGEHHHLNLFMPYMRTAYTAYLNGREIARNGTIGRTKPEMHPQYTNRIVTAGSLSGTVDLVIHCSNFYHRQGGFYESIRLGTDRDVYLNRLLSALIDFALIGSILLMGLYHFSLFALRHTDRAALMFGLFCLTVCGYIFIVEDYWITLIFPDIDWNLLKKLEYMASILAAPAFAAFVQVLYPREVVRSVAIAYYVFCGVFALFNLFAPVRTFSAYIFIFQVVTLIGALALFYPFILVIRRKLSGAIPAL
ncbi:MAG: 7TM-DISM domain-containing protein, partial [Leptospiraceae bacterium]|nr:7TM-DISM domain-containing protein [Leptospiraceae bacterium]